MIKSVVACAALLAVGASATDTNATLPGTAVPYGVVHQVAVGPSYVEDLMAAMTNRTNYADTVGRPICVIEVKKVSIQIVAGINYQFEVEGCSQTFSDNLGLCPETGCKVPALWEIDVFVQEWNNTYRVDRIKFLQ